MGDKKYLSSLPFGGCCGAFGCADGIFLEKFQNRKNVQISFLIHIRKIRSEGFMEAAAVRICFP